jgi:hypothetical protein
MSQNVERLRVLRGEDTKRPAIPERRDEVLHFPVDFDGERVLEEPLADGADYVARQSALLDLANGAVGEREFEHF